MKKVSAIARSPVVSLLFVLAMVTLVTALRVTLAPLVGSGVPLMLYLLVVILSALLYGISVGISATIISILAAIIWVIPVMDASNMVRVSFFSLVAFLCAAFCALARNNRIKIKDLLADSEASAANEKQLREQIEVKERDRIEILNSLELSNNQLAESHDRFERVAQAANIGIWSWVNESSSMHSSAEFRYHLGLPFGVDLKPQHFMESIVPEQRENVRQAILGATENNEIFDLHFRTLERGPSPSKWIRVAGWVDQDPDAEAKRIDGITLDISTYKRAVEEMELAKTIAERASLAKSRFLAQMSHEIRSPMGAILGYTQILIDDELIRDDDNRDLLQRIRVNGDHLMHIIDDILDLSKFESGKITIENAAFSPVKLVQEVMQSFSSIAEHKGLHLSFHSLCSIETNIYSDPARLKQILFNLIGNAIKFTEHGGVEVEVRDLGEQLEFSIRDSGVGLSEEQIPRLFQPFEQADSSINRKFGGTGLGLVLSRHLAEALGGDLGLSSEGVGKGSVFSFRIAKLGRKDLGQEAASISTADTKIDLQGIRVLLAEDSPDSAAIVSRLLTRAGAKLSLATNGFEVLELSKSDDFDIVLMDVQMPGMDGLEATTKLRERGFQKPIIALTAHALPEEKIRSAVAGCNAHLTKPIDKNVLLHSIRQFTLDEKI